MVSVIIVNYNGRGVLADCLRSVDRQIYKDFELVLVDNGSSDGSLEEAERVLADLSIGTSTKLVPLKANLGFAGGNIRGLQEARGEFIALLNNDTEAEAGWLAALVPAMENDPAIGICASKLICHGSPVVDSAGDGFLTTLKGFKRGEGQTDGPEFGDDKFLFGACAGAALYRRTMLEEIGFLDEDFFLIHEDTDLNFRAQIAGWKVVYVARATVYHKVRSSIGSMSPMAVYYTLRNSELVRIKNVPLMLFLRCLPSYFIGSVVEVFYFVLRHGHFRLYVKAKYDALKMFPMMLKKRRDISKTKRVDTEYLIGMLTGLREPGLFRSKARKLFYG